MRMDVSQSDLSAILKGRFREYSVHQLAQMLQEIDSAEH